MSILKLENARLLLLVPTSRILLRIVEEGRGGTKSFDLGWYVDNHADLRKKFGKNNYPAAFNRWIEEGNEDQRLTAPKRRVR